MSTVDWRICAITYNVAMKMASEEAADSLLSSVIDINPDIIVVGLQEVAHAETIGGTVWTWLRLIVDWVTMRTGLVLLTKTFQATNQAIVFVKKSIVSKIEHVEYRFGRNSWGGITGHKGSIGVRIRLKNKSSLVFVVSHFVHDVAAYDRRIMQYKTNRNCAFDDDRRVKCVFWLGDLNFRVELSPRDAARKISGGKLDEMLENDEQLTRAMEKKEAFEDFEEAPVTFNPTYRVYVGSKNYDLNRTPSWTDRILYKGSSVTPVSYGAVEDCLASDHLPVMGVYTLTVESISSVSWEAMFEHLPTWYSSVPLVGRFHLKNDFWNRSGSYRDWIGLFPADIVDCTSAVKWVWVATCYDQIHENEKYIVCEYLNVPAGDYRLGYFSANNGCLVGLSKSFRVTDPPCEGD